VYTIRVSKKFLRQAGKFFRMHPDLNERFAMLVEELRTDPFAPHLELHGLTGKLKGCYAVILTHKYRVTLTLLVTEKEIVLLDIGSHDEVYRDR
jgi:addiction module RelE/StbE family toxin